MKDKNRPFIAAVLSLFLSGLGQIYLHKISRGLILALSFSCAIIIIWLSVSNVEFVLFKWKGDDVKFGPSQKYISFGEQAYRAADILKITGTIQLVFTWLYGIIDAWREGKKQSLSSI